MSRFPDGRRFAFTIFDDTDCSTVQNTRPVYELLADLGLQTSKSVWPLKASPVGEYGGGSLQEQDYREFVLWLKSENFEIGLHSVRNQDTPRTTVCEGLELFRSILGHYPKCHANHHKNRDNLYWGTGRLRTWPSRGLYLGATAPLFRPRSEGHVAKSSFFWGDVCRSRITYVRNLVFPEINLDRVNPTLPYHDPEREFVNFWFSSCEGADVKKFCKLLSERNQDQLEEEGGVCIMYTHFACGFVQNGSVAPEFVRLMTRLSQKNGWFAPVSTVLDRLREQQSSSEISSQELSQLERRWLSAKFRKGTS